MDVEELGLLVCGGATEGLTLKPGRKCYLFRHNADEWEEFYDLNVGRVNAYMLRVQTNITIIGGSTTHPFKPMLNTEEVLDLNSIEKGWGIQDIDEGIHSKMAEVVVGIQCETLDQRSTIGAA